MPSPHQIVCESCNADIPAEDVNIEMLVARCRACDAVFDCSHQIRRGGDASSTREPPTLPAGLTLREDPTSITIERRWRGPGTGFLIFFTIFWDGFLVFWYFIAFSQGSPLIMKIFPMLHVAVGAAITYYTMAMVLNTTTIRASYNMLSVKHAPIWWWGSRTLDAADVKQLFTKKSSVKQNDQALWNVMLDTYSGKRLGLATNLDDRDHAKYIEHAVERFLGLEDKRAG